MKTIGGVFLNLIAFIIIWLGSAVLTIVFAFHGWGESAIGEHLRLAMAWFICPGIGGYYAPKITVHFLKDLNLDSVFSSFITIITIVFFLMLLLSFIGGEVKTSILLQSSLQFSSALIGTLLSKFVLKNHS